MMKARASYHRILVLGLLMVTLVSASGIFYWNSKTLSRNQQIERNYRKAMSGIAKRENELLSTFHDKIQFLQSLLIRKEPQQHPLALHLKALGEIRLKQQDDFDRFEALNAQIGQIIIAEIFKLREGKSGLLRNEEDLRQLERLDLRIDRARQNLSEETFHIVSEVSKLRKPLLNPKPHLPVPHFKVDHLIFGQKDLGLGL